MFILAIFVKINMVRLRRNGRLIKLGTPFKSFYFPKPQAGVRFCLLKPGKLRIHTQLYIPKGTIASPLRLNGVSC